MGCSFKLCSHRFFREYSGGDFLVAGLFWLLTGAVELFPMHHSYIVDGDARIRFPYLAPQVPTWLLIVLCIPLPLLIIATCAWVRFLRHKDSHFAKHEALTAVCALILSGGISTFFTDAVKHLVGRPRPNFVAYCQWVEATGCGKPAPDAWASFVSGHSSLAFATLTILSLYLLTVMRASRRQAALNTASAAATATTPTDVVAVVVQCEVQADDKVTIARRIELATSPDNVAWIYCVCLIPMLLAGWIAVTRVMDYWHNTDDILGGSAIGLGCALLVGRFKLKSLEYAQPYVGPTASPTTTTTPSPSVLTVSQAVEQTA